MSQDVHPSPDEIKPYVSVGPTKELSVTVQKETFDSAFLTITIIFGLALFVIVGLTIFFAYQQSKLPPPPPPVKLKKVDPTLHSNVGAAASAASLIGNNINLPEDGSALITQSECLSQPNTVWNGSNCQCKPPFFGPICSREKHDKRYYAVGIPNEDTLQFTVLDEIMSNGKSFNSNGSQGSCSDYCNKSEECIGFIYHNPYTSYGDVKQQAGMCTLLKDNVVVPADSTISYSNDLESTLYMRSSDNLQFENRIFLGGYTGSFPPRYWLVKETPSYLQLLPGEIRSISFVPVYTEIKGYYTGIYCLHPFSSEDIDVILDRGNTSECYIHQQNSQINIPSHWKYRTPIYVAYV